MERMYRLVKKEDFENVFRKGRFLKGLFLSLKARKTDLGYMRVGIVVGQKISKKAVLRNRIRRQLREAVKKHAEDSKSGVDVVVVPSPEIIGKSFQAISKEVEKLFEQLK